jgi:cell division protein FtsQ
MKKWLKIVVMVLVFVGTIVVLTAAHQREDDVLLTDPEIKIDVQDGIALLTESELRDELEMNQFYRSGMKKQELDVEGIEEFLVNLNEVASAEVYIDIGGKWHVDIETRRPIARIIMNNRPDFYIDNSNGLMDVSVYSKPKILGFTGLELLFDQAVNLDSVINNDSLKTKYKLDQIYRISSYVCNSAFYDAQIVQVHFDKEDGFVLIPRVGNQTIIFGAAPSDDVVEKKFLKLTTFYDEVIPFEGWEKYKEINLKFKDQIVAKKN